MSVFFLENRIEMRANARCADEGFNVGIRHIVRAVTASVEMYRRFARIGIVIDGADETGVDFVASHDLK